MDTSELLSVGDRVDDGAGYRGTIRYVGPVATSKDATTLYYGIEWDTWGRGLNDGSVVLSTGERVVYFDGPAGRKKKTSTSSPSSADDTVEFKCSFVKVAKFQPSTIRSSLLERLQERYVAPQQAPAPSIPSAEDVVVTGEVGTTLGSQKPIELVGVEKLKTQQTLHTIEKISLSQCQIAILGSEVPGELNRLTPNITELNLSFNLFRSWTQIFQIARELPALETLILSGNQLEYEARADIESDQLVFPQVKVLVLNQTMITWKELVVVLGRHFPGLTELYVADNEYTDQDIQKLVDMRDNNGNNRWMESLLSLDMSQNYLQSWAVIQQAIGTSFANLKQLVLNDNQITTLMSPGQFVQVFQQLKSLSINDNRIDSWTSIDALNQYPQLDTLRFMRNPLTAHMGAGEARMIIIARTEYLTVFNASGIREKERRDAEQMYLKRILHELAVVGDGEESRNSVLVVHPRFQQLRQLYPEITVNSGAGSGGGAAGGPATLASSLIQIKIVPMSMEATTFDPLVKKIPEKMKIAQLKLLVEKKYGIPAPAQLLSFRADARSIPLPLDDDSCEIGYYGLQDGAEVLVNDA